MHLDAGDGLTHDCVSAVWQDQRGFMWFGTRDGLNRYDGYTVTAYKTDIYDSTSISDNWITAIVEDSAGYLWVGTMTGGINRFDPVSGTNRRFPRFEKHQPDRRSPWRLYPHDTRPGLRFTRRGR